MTRKLPILLLGAVCLSLIAAAEESGALPAWEERLNRREPISMELAEAELGPVLTLFTRKYGINLVAVPEAQGRVTLQLDRAPAGSALRAVLRAAGYEVLDQGGILRLVPAQDLAKAVEADRVLTEVFHLKYVDAELLQSAVRGLLSKEGRAEGFRRQATAPGASPKASQTLIVSDHALHLEAVRNLVQRLDSPSRQVLIEARVMEVSVRRQKDFGIAWNVEAAAGGAGRPTTAPFNTTGTTRFFPGTFPTPSAASSSSATTGGQFAFGTVDFTSFRATLKLLEADGSTELLSDPRIVTLDNEEAKITVGTTIPLELFERNRFTGNLEISGYQDKNVGIELRVTPRIGKAGAIVIDLHPKVEEILEFRGTFQRPVTRTRSVDTRVAVQHGRTLVIGGLIERVDRKTRTAVPVVSKIPLVGGLFRNDQDVAEKRNLLIFLTPWILQGGEEAPKAGAFPSLAGGGEAGPSPAAKAPLQPFSGLASKLLGLLGDIAQQRQEGITLQELSNRLRNMDPLAQDLAAAARQEGEAGSPLHKSAQDAVRAVQALRQRWQDQIQGNKPLDLEEAWALFLDRLGDFDAEARRESRE